MLEEKKNIKMTVDVFKKDKKKYKKGNYYEVPRSVAKRLIRRNTAEAAG